MPYVGTISATLAAGCRSISGLLTEGRNLIMFDGPSMLRVNWPVVDTIHPQSNKFATGVKIKGTGE